MSIDSIVTLSVFARIFGLGFGTGAVFIGLTIKLIQRLNSRQEDRDEEEIQDS